jgi:hypothetical protein
MARTKHPIPKNGPLTISKLQILDTLSMIDGDTEAQKRVLALESAFRRRASGYISTAPNQSATLEDFSTSPFVLMIHCLKREYSRISEIEKDILPAKEFSSMETSAGRMVEDIALPTYGWEQVLSAMHSAYSALDAQRLTKHTLYVATLKSGPRCLNDEMSENFADAILIHAPTWAKNAKRTKIDFTYGVLYGTPKLSNKKDWHILRNVVEKLEASQTGTVTIRPDNQWHCEYVQNSLTVRITVRIGLDWWTHLGESQSCFIEVCTALIRACVAPKEQDAASMQYLISDLGEIVSTSTVPEEYNVALLQRGQLPWLFFLARHFCDKLI